MSSWLALLSFFPLFLCAFSGQEKPSAYEALQQYDFPVGLLPQGAIGYDLKPSTGQFSAYLNGTCSFTLTNLYKLTYKNTISGVISKDRLTKVKGVGVKVLNMLPLKIVEVRRNGVVLEFSVGITSANFPVRDFEVSPECGCGFNCVSEDDDRKNKSHLPLNLYLSSSS
ncbi:hypothetical protein ACH5RR_020013 [Cinchona calisaya]|uniref:Uncharacterized protein n=1 Tax=Cinchona calisaya TaxID=153742 RepID=A0ABD2ZD72_9GENT